MTKYFGYVLYCFHFNDVVTLVLGSCLNERFPFKLQLQTNWLSPFDLLFFGDSCNHSVILNLLVQEKHQIRLGNTTKGGGLFCNHVSVKLISSIKIIIVIKIKTFRSHTYKSYLFETCVLGQWITATLHSSYKKTVGKLSVTFHSSHSTPLPFSHALTSLPGKVYTF